MIEKTGEGLRVVAPMLIANANALLEAGRAALKQSGAQTSVVFDLSAVAESDSSALAVLFGWLRTAVERGVSVKIAHPPAGLLSQAALYGVTDYLPFS